MHIILFKLTISISDIATMQLTIWPFTPSVETHVAGGYSVSFTWPMISTFKAELLSHCSSSAIFLLNGTFYHNVLELYSTLYHNGLELYSTFCYIVLELYWTFYQNVVQLCSTFYQSSRTTLNILSHRSRTLLNILSQCYRTLFNILSKCSTTLLNILSDVLELYSAFTNSIVFV
jgi:hypothetical protein